MRTEHVERIVSVKRRRTEEARRGKRTFKLGHSACGAFFNIENATFHDPVCEVVEPGEDTSYVKATFFGSGVLTHPVRYGHVPNYWIQGNYPWALHLWLSVTGWMRTSQ